MVAAEDTPTLPSPACAAGHSRPASEVRAQRNAHRNRFDRFREFACAGRFDLRRQGVRGLLALAVACAPATAGPATEPSTFCLPRLTFCDPTQVPLREIGR